MTRLLALAVSVILGCASVAKADSSDKLDVVERAVSAYIQPGYERLADEASLLTEAVASLCSDPSSTTLAAARTWFAAMVRAWSWIEFVRFGPILKDNRFERIHFWPDRRGIGLRQVQAVLANKDATAIDPIRLEKKSVALQGLGALEFVLHGTGSYALAEAESDSFRCAYGRAVSTRLTSVASEIQNEWQAANGISDLLVRPAPDNALYRSADESLAQILGILVYGFEAIRDVKLQPFLGETAEKARPKRAPFHRAGVTVDGLRTNFAGLRHLFETSGAELLLPAEHRWIGGSMIFEFQNADNALKAVTLPIEDAVKDTGEYGRLKYTLILTRSLQQLVANEMTPALGLAVGFSALDGD